MTAKFKMEVSIMRKSARILGQDYGLNSEEMNYILKMEGYLSGNPGEYDVTEKGNLFAEEEDHHRGTGGYAHYNRYWTTRTWDESIGNELNITDDMVSEARTAAAIKRKERWDEIKTARAEADAEFLAKQNQLIDEDYDDKESSCDSSGVVEAGLIIGGLIVIGYGVYKATPQVIKWWKNKVAPKFKASKNKLNQEKPTKNMPCPSCGSLMELDKGQALWKCSDCDYSILEETLNNGEVFWFCDRCETFMNTQRGFNIMTGGWVCTECGFDNDVNEVNINE